MAIWAFGATYDNVDMSGRFIGGGVACIGFRPEDDSALSLHRVLRSIKVGDLAFIKSRNPQSYRIKAVGVVTGEGIEHHGDLGWGVQVRWVWQGLEEFPGFHDKYNVQSNTLYEEFTPEICDRVIELLLSRLNE